MFCAISGVVPEQPVVSKKSGHVFERRLIEKYIEANAKCPVTGQPLALDDLIPIQVNRTVKPRAPNATSFPGMLTLFQNEWDSLMLETYSVRQHLEQVKQELSQALYQHDAACRVIARLIKERDAARDQLARYEAAAVANSGPSANNASGNTASTRSMEVDDDSSSTGASATAAAGSRRSGLSKSTVDAMLARSAELSKERKKRKVSASLVPKEGVAGFGLSSASPLHGTSKPGILTLDIHPTTSNLLLTGGQDGSVYLYDRVAGEVKSIMEAHHRRVTDVLFHPTQSVVFSASADRTVRVWRATDEDNWTAAHVFKEHSDEIVGLALQPTGDYLVSAAADMSWGFLNVETGVCETFHQEDRDGYSAVQFHPDGLILGLGTQGGSLRIWDVKQEKSVRSLNAHKDRITSLCFSENGYLLASSSLDGTAKIWDLRALDKEPRDILGPDHGFSVVNNVRFDYSGVYLGVAGTKAAVFATKTGDIVKLLEDNTAPVTDIAFGPDASFFATTSMDRHLRIYRS